MTFEDLQDDLYAITNDFDLKWQKGGVNLKLAVQFWLKQAHDFLNKDYTFKEQNNKLLKLNFINNKSDLPDDFYTEVWLYSSEYDDLDESLNNFFIDRQNKKIVLRDSSSKTLFFRYMPKEKKLVELSDHPLLIDFFRELVALYGKEKYFLYLDDVGNAWQSILYADEKAKSLLNKYF